MTTKSVDASIRVEPPKGKIKPRGVSTTTLQDVADIAEKKRRDDIMAEQKLAMKDAKKIAIAEKPKLIEPSKELMAELKRKPWKDMTDEEKKIEYKERAKRAAITRAAKKKEGLK